MTTTGKDLRIRLPESSREAFTTAKAKAERELGMTLRDNEFAARVLVQAIKEMANENR
jgi:hypothetical protein